MKQRDHLSSVRGYQNHIAELEHELHEAQARIAELEAAAKADAEGYHRAVAKLADEAHAPRQFAKECTCGNLVVGWV